MTARSRILEAIKKYPNIGLTGQQWHEMFQKHESSWYTKECKNLQATLRNLEKANGGLPRGFFILRPESGVNRYGFLGRDVSDLADGIVTITVGGR
jgi:hypothetical protein